MCECDRVCKFVRVCECVCVNVNCGQWQCVKKKCNIKVTLSFPGLLYPE